MSRIVKVLYGPTATGKSAAALEIAAQEPIVIINSDAMQCYDAIPTLTAQPTLDEQAKVPHKLYSVIPPQEDMIVTKWCELAKKEIDTAFEESKQPVLVGGTGFYLKALMEGLSDIPNIPADIREKAEEILENEGLESLLNDLKNYSIKDTEELDCQNPRRVIRAWEVLEFTGKSLQEWQRQNQAKKPQDMEFDLKFITRPREELIARINQRFDQMIKNGALDEVKSLSSKIDDGTVSEDNLIIKAHGFRPLRAYLKGVKTLEDATEQSKIETRQYAKRQMTWARQQFGYKA